MKKIFLFALLNILPLSAQEYEMVRFSLPRLDHTDNFFEFRSERFPSDFAHSPEDAKKIAAAMDLRTTETEEDGHIILKQYDGQTLVVSQSFTKKGLPDGQAVLYYPNGQAIQDIPFVKGKAQGTGFAYDRDGMLMVETTYKDDKRHGVRRMHSRRGDIVMEGTFENGNVAGRIIVTEKRGGRYIYPPDLKRGTVEVYYGTLKAAEIPIIEEDVLHGIAREYYPDGKLKNVVRYANNRRHGLSEHYKADGTLLFSNMYNSGEPVGDYKFVSQDGAVIQEGKYDAYGRKTGLWITRDFSGRPSREEYYEAGRLHGLQKNYLNGGLHEVIPWKHGKKEGTSRMYSEKTGELTGEYGYKADQKLFYKGYYANGKLFTDYFYKENAPQITRYYEPTGKLLHEAKYSVKGMPVGIHKLIMQEGNSYTVKSETHYDSSGKLLKIIMYHNPPGSYFETSFNGEKQHGPRTEYNSETGEKKVTYSFDGKPVTEQEFKELSKKQKK